VIYSNGWANPFNPMRFHYKHKLVIEPFEKWDLNFMGPINPSSHQKYYILVCMDYVTKWVEARALPKSIEKVVMDFLFEEIFFWYGMPREIVIDRGEQFTGKKIEALLKKYKIQHRVTSPYHPCKKMGRSKAPIKYWKTFLQRQWLATSVIGPIDCRNLYGITRKLGEIQWDSLHLSWCMVSVLYSN
jgi:hypothetical protein